jgi:transcription antitermination factor NusG
MAFWAVARTQPQREAVAVHFLKLTGFEVYLPRILRTQTTRRGRLVERPTPLFPTYVFVLITLQWHAVNSTIGIVRLIMDGARPARLADDTLDQIRAREQSGFVQLPPAPPRFHHGQRVRVIRGPFEGHDGLYAGQAAHERERVLLRLLGRPVPVDVPSADLVPQHAEPHVMSAISIPDADYSFIAAAARQLPPTLRPIFTARVHALLAEIADPGPGAVDRAVRMALQGIWDPPARTGAQVRPIKGPRLVVD